MSKVCPECKYNNENDSIICEKCGCDLEQYKIDSKKSNNKRIEYSYYKSATSNEINECSIDERKKPKITKYIVFGISEIIIGILFFIWCITKQYTESIFYFSVLIFICCGLYYLKIGVNDLKEIRHLCQINTDDEYDYKKIIKKYYDDKWESQQEMRQIIKGIENENKRRTKRNIKCPYCSSYNTKKISTSSRVVSATMIGIASSKIGKQWHCNDCNSNF